MGATSYSSKNFEMPQKNRQSFAGEANFFFCDFAVAPIYPVYVYYFSEYIGISITTTLQKMTKEKI